MTREDAVNMLKSKMDGHTDISYEWAETIRMAIEALEQKPCNIDTCKVAKAYMNEWDKPNNSDEISRQAVFNILLKYKLDESRIAEELEKLPPVTPQPKTGHWITTRTFMHDGEYYCDQCKCDSPNNEKWDYCPNCGAKMESEETE